MNLFSFPLSPRGSVILGKRTSVDNKSAFALAAALAQVVAPNDAQVVNLLGFHVIAKLLVHYPAYLANIAPPRSLAHVTATAALINVCWRLAAGN
jgi:uncharacterized MAPEG superfamily protein